LFFYLLFIVTTIYAIYESDFDMITSENQLLSLLNLIQFQTLAYYRTPN